MRERIRATKSSFCESKGVVPYGYLWGKLKGTNQKGNWEIFKGWREYERICNMIKINFKNLVLKPFYQGHSRTRSSNPPKRFSKFSHLLSRKYFCKIEIPRREKLIPNNKQNLVANATLSKLSYKVSEMFGTIILNHASGIHDLNHKLWKMEESFSNFKLRIRTCSLLGFLFKLHKD